MCIDIVGLLRSALGEGAGSELLVGVKGDSTVCLEFKNNIVVHVANLEGDVWLWARMPRCITDLIGSCVASFLNILVTPYEWARGHHLMFPQHDGVSEAVALLHPDWLQDGRRLSMVISEFVSVVACLCEVFQGLPISGAQGEAGHMLDSKMGWLSC